MCLCAVGYVSAAPGGVAMGAWGPVTRGGDLLGGLVSAWKVRVPGPVFGVSRRPAAAAAGCRGRCAEQGRSRSGWRDGAWRRPRRKAAAVAGEAVHVATGRGPA